MALIAEDGFMLDPAEDWCQSRRIVVEQYHVFAANRPTAESGRLLRVFVDEHEVCGLSVPDAMRLSTAIAELTQECYRATRVADTAPQGATGGAA